MIDESIQQSKPPAIVTNTGNNILYLYMYIGGMKSFALLSFHRLCLAEWLMTDWTFTYFLPKFFKGSSPIDSDLNRYVIRNFTDSFSTKWKS
jgi:hypothetical protein